MECIDKIKRFWHMQTAWNGKCYDAKVMKAQHARGRHVYQQVDTAAERRAVAHTARNTVG